MCHCSRHKGIPACIGTLKVFFCVDSACRWFVCYGNTNGQTRREWTQLLESFDLLQRMWRKRYPLVERVTRIRVDADVLQCSFGQLAPVRLVSQVRYRCAREVHGSTVVTHDDLDETWGIEDLSAGARRRGTKRKLPARDQLGGAADGAPSDEWLVALHVHNCRVFPKAGLRGDLGDALSSR